MIQCFFFFFGDDVIMAIDMHCEYMRCGGQVDPQLEWMMSVRMRKPWHQWVEQLFSDESVEAQVR